MKKITFKHITKKTVEVVKLSNYYTMKKTKNKNEDLKYRITNTRHSTVLAVFRKKVIAWTDY